MHQLINPVEFINTFEDRIFHVHIKDSRVKLNGCNSILASHCPLAITAEVGILYPQGVEIFNGTLIIRALNRIGYDGPLSIEWEDSGMDREWGVRDALQVVRKQ